MKPSNTAPFRAILIIVFSISSHIAYSQKTDSTKSIANLGGVVTLTNNGISLLPTFTLGKPAIMFDLSVGKKKLSFEPMLRFALEGKPWAFIFWWRYKFISKGKFRLSAGAHPSIVFRTMPVTSNGVTNDAIVAQRFLAAEVVPNYLLTKDISVGFYYLHGQALQKEGIQSTDFITFNSNFSNIKLSKQVYIKFNPQVYYLKMDDLEGFYATSTLTLAKRNFPLSLQSIMNQTIKSDIPANKEFVWNVSLVYSFSNEYAKKQLK